MVHPLTMFSSLPLACHILTAFLVMTPGSLHDYCVSMQVQQTYQQLGTILETVTWKSTQESPYLLVGRSEELEDPLDSP